MSQTELKVQFNRIVQTSHWASFIPYLLSFDLLSLFFLLWQQYTHVENSYLEKKHTKKTVFTPGSIWWISWQQAVSGLPQENKRLKNEEQPVPHLLNWEFADKFKLWISFKSAHDFSVSFHCSCKKLGQMEKTEVGLRRLTCLLCEDHLQVVQESLILNQGSGKQAHFSV